MNNRQKHKRHKLTRTSKFIISMFSLFDLWVLISIIEVCILNLISGDVSDLNAIKIMVELINS